MLGRAISETDSPPAVFSPAFNHGSLTKDGLGFPREAWRKRSDGGELLRQTRIWVSGALLANAVGFARKDDHVIGSNLPWLRCDRHFGQQRKDSPTGLDQGAAFSRCLLFRCGKTSHRDIAERHRIVMSGEAKVAAGAVFAPVL